MATRLQSRSYAEAINNAAGVAGTGSSKASVFPQHNRISKKSLPKNAKESNAPKNNPKRDNAQHAGKCKVVGARRIWGPFYYCSPNAVLNCVKKVTGIDKEFKIKKKTKDLASNKTI